MKRPHQYLLLSLGIIVLAASLLLLWAYPDSGKLGPYFSASVVVLFLRDVALYVSILCLLLRLFKVLSKLHFLYIFVATLNGCVGVLGIVLYFVFHTDIIWLHLCLYNLLLGLVLLSDSFLSSYTPSSGHS